MNIWIVNHYANSPDSPGDARHFSHARELMRMGHNVRIVACSFVHLKGEHNSCPGESWTDATHEGVPFTWIRACACEGESFRRVRNMLEFAARTARGKWSEGLETPDLVVGSTPHPFAALAAERLARRYQVPFVLEVRDVWPFVLTEVGGYSPRHPFVMLVDRTMRFLYRRAKRIAVFSRYAEPLLAEYGADPRKLVWIPHGVDLALSPEPTQPAPKKAFVVTYLGAHGQWNNLETVVDAARYLSNRGHDHVQFRLIGEGAAKRGLMERAARYRLQNITFSPAVQKYQIRNVCSEADAFVLNNRPDEVSRRWMSFSKLYEYLAAGRPVVFGSCAKDNPVQDAGAGTTVRAGDFAAMAEAILALSRMDPGRRLEMGKRAREHVVQHYNIARLAAVFERMAREVVEEFAAARQAPKAREVRGNANAW